MLMFSIRMKFRCRLILGLLLATAALVRAEDSLQVGVAFADITPIAGVDEMVAMGGRQALVHKIHDPLYANAVVFKQGEDRVALVSLDLIWVEPEVLKSIRDGITQETGITQVICAVTHTHGSGRPPVATAAKIIPQAIAAAVEANTTLEPARIGYGHGELHEGYNRRVVKSDGTVEMLWNNRDRLPTSPVDPEVGVLSIKRLRDDSTLATLVNYSVHPVISMNFEELIVSADYPGAMARKVEAELGGRCIFLLGAAGDINPFDADMFRYATEDETVAAIDRLAEKLATVVKQIARDTTVFHANTALSYEQVDVPMALREDGLHGDKSLKVELDTFVIGGRFAMATIAGEPFVELGLKLKRRSPAAATWVIANCNDYHGYIPTTQATTEGGYGAASGTILEVGAGERLINQAVVSIHHQLGLVKPLE